MSLIDLPGNQTVGAGVQVRLGAESLKVPPRFPLEPAVQGRESATAQVEGVRPLSDPRSQLRRTLRAQRRNLPPALRRTVTRAIVAALLRSPVVRRARTLALYLAHDGEVDLSGLVYRLRQHHKRLFLPRVPPRPRRRLEFVPYPARGRWRSNRFGIPEPVNRRTWKAQRLDAVLTPLVGYTADGARLGMGGGFYDRSFAYRHWRSTTKPRLIGVGFACQQRAHLPQAPWDVRLDAWVNEREIRYL